MVFLLGWVPSGRGGLVSELLAIVRILDHSYSQDLPSIAHSHLVHVNLAHNQLTCLPDLCKVIRLRSLDLSHNQIRALNGARSSLPENLKVRRLIIID